MLESEFQIGNSGLLSTPPLFDINSPEVHFLGGLRTWY